MIDRTTATWCRVRDWAMGQIHISSVALESTETNQEMTAYHRGRVAALRSLISLDNSTAVIAADVPYS